MLDVFLAIKRISDERALLAERRDREREREESAESAYDASTDHGNVVHLYPPSHTSALAMHLELLLREACDASAAASVAVGFVISSEQCGEENMLRSIRKLLTLFSNSLDAGVVLSVLVIVESRGP